MLRKKISQQICSPSHAVAQPVAASARIARIHGCRRVGGSARQAPALIVSLHWDP